MRTLFLLLLSSLCFHSAAQYDEPSPLYLHNSYSPETKLVDLDQDGDMDMLHSYGWYENKGAGVFGAEQGFIDLEDYPVVFNGGEVEDFSFTYVKDFYAEDMDLDGDLDVVISNTFPGIAIGYIENLGSVNFAPIQWITDALPADAMRLGDVDNDGDQDIIYNSEDLSYWVENLGDGSFENSQIIHDSHLGQLMEIYDIDNDGVVEVITSHGGFQIFEQTDSLAYYSFEDDAFVGPDYMAFPYVSHRGMRFFDFDQDGADDLILSGSSSIYWMRNLGNNDFDFPEFMVSVEMGNVFHDAIYEFYDLDNDGDYEIIVDEMDNSFDRDVRIHFNWGDGVFNSGLYDLPIDLVGVGIGNIDVHDLNEDGFPDIFACLSAGTAHLLKNNGTPGSYSEPEELYTLLFESQEIISDDFSFDGKQDILVVNDRNAGPGNIWSFRSLDGGFSSYRTTKVNFSNDPEEGQDISVRDVNQDNIPDLVFIGQFSDRLSVRHGLANGKYSGGADEDVPAIQDYSIGDVNMDGILDFVCSDSLGQVFFVLQGQLGTLAVPSLISDQHQGKTSVVALFADEDNIVDFISYSEGDGQLALIINAGDGQNYDHQALEFPLSGPASLAVADMDGDGDDDLITASPNMGLLAFYPNEGGDFSEQIPLNITSLNPEQVKIEDIDMDGDPDIHFISTGDRRFSWIENLGEGLFSDEQIILTDNSLPKCQHFADVDDDGDKDWIYASGNALYVSDRSGNPGCMDPEACNYDELADVSTDTCCYGVCGCTDPQAFNFGGDCDGTCVYPLYGYVFNDLNQNQVWDPGEPPLPGQETEITALGNTSTTNSEGRFEFAVTPGFYTVRINPSEEYPSASGSLTRNCTVYTFGQSDEIEFGVYDPPEFPPVRDVVISNFMLQNQYLCDSEVFHVVGVFNEGNTTESGIVKILPDSNFVSVDIIEEPDSIVNDTLFYSFELNPSGIANFPFYILQQNFESIGQYFDFSSWVYLFNEDEELESFDEDLDSMELVCAYDPNDKQSFPHGYAEPNYILNEELEYLIRFQNTGNAPAQRVIVSDTISDLLQLESLELLEHSHSVIINKYPDENRVEFVFDNIMLPDSTCCFDESIGYVKFKVDPVPDLAHGTEITNKAFIYFDSNPAIITNTTLNTIYECQQEYALIEGELFQCSADSLELFNSYPFVESYEWTSDSILLSTESFLNMPSESGDIPIHLQISNPLCVATDSIMVSILESPVASFETDGDVLTAIEAENYQWYFNGEPIEGENSQSLNVTENGGYSVQVWNVLGCSDLSSEEMVIVNSMGKEQFLDLELYPNPFQDRILLSMIDGISIERVEFFGLSGKSVLLIEEPTSDNPLQIDTGILESGTYVIKIETVNGTLSRRVVKIK